MPNRKRRSRRSSDTWELLNQSDEKVSPPKRRYEPGESESGPSSSTDPAEQEVEENKVEYISPSAISFSQDTINYKFGDGRTISGTLEDLKSKKITIEDLPKMTVIIMDGTYFTHDNRRLCVLQKYEDYLGKKLLAPVNIGKRENLRKHRLTTQLRKCGKSVEIVREDFKTKNRRKDKTTDKVMEKWTCPKTPSDG